MASARVAALRLLTRRDYTAAELRDKLIAREIAPEEIDEAIASLTADRLIDDRRTAAAHVRLASGVKQRGRLRIERELQRRGVDRALIREVLSDLPPEDEAASIAAFLDRRRIPVQLSADAHRRVFQQLLRRGFAADAIAKALRERHRTG